jgi:hypothetical protein
MNEKDTDLKLMGFPLTPTRRIPNKDFKPLKQHKHIVHVASKTNCESITVHRQVFITDRCLCGVVLDQATSGCEQDFVREES